MKELFIFRNKLSKKIDTIVFVIGTIIVLLLWQLSSLLIPNAIFPPPSKVILSIPELITQHDLLNSLFYSIQLNVLGNLQAVAIAIPLGFLIGLVPLFNSMFNRYLDVLRFAPLPVFTGVFIVLFGIGSVVKVQFLAFATFVYLLPVIVQRLDETNKVYEDTAFTLGAKQRDLLSTLYLPDTLSRLYDDIRVLLAISWTYITIVEVIVMSGGIGALAYACRRTGRIDMIFAIVLIIFLWGILQDLFLKWFKKILFPYVNSESYK